MNTKWIRTLAVLMALLMVALFQPSMAGAQGVIAPGETRTGTISPVGDSDTWTFSATTGDAIVIRVGEITQSGSFTPRIRLFNPSAVLLSSTSGTVAAEITVTAAATGTFSVIVDDAVGTTATGTYRLTLAKTGDPIVVSAGDEGGPMTNGVMHTGTIDVGDLDVWTVDALAGDRIIVRMGEVVALSTLTPQLRIYAPTGALLGNSSTTVGAEVEITAPSTGTYMVLAGDLSGGFSGSGAYRLTLAKTGSPVVVSAGDEGGPLTNGGMHTGVIDVGDLDLWTATANAGESIVVRMGKTVPGSTLTPYLRIYGPTGTLLDSSNTTVGAEVAITAPASGTYLVVAADLTGSFSGSGAYRLTMAKTGSPVVVSAGDEGGPMTNGAMHTGTLDVGDLDVWTVDATVGQSIVVRMGETVAGSSLTPWLRLYSPTGALVSNNSTTIGAEVSTVAASSGTFLVLAGDLSGSFSGSGGYRLTLAKTGDPVVVSAGDEGGPLTNGAMHTGFIDVGDLDVWTLTASVGDSIIVRMGETVPGSSLTPYLRIYGPTGALLGSSTTTIAAEVAVTAAASGTFLVVAGDLSGSFSGSGAYRLTLAKTGSPVVVSPGDEGGPMTNGVVHTGTLDVGDLDVWTFTAAVGDSVVVRMAEAIPGSPLTPWLRIYSPTGALVDSSTTTVGAEVSFTAAAGGTFLVVAADLSGSFSGSGDYRLMLAKTGDPVVVSPGDQGGPMTNGAMHTGVIDVGDLDLWTFNANVGDRIVVRMGEVTPGSSLTPWLRIYSPTGTELASNSTTIGAEVAVTAPASGKYLVIAADLSGSFSGSGPYRLTLAKTGSPVSVSPGDEGGPLPDGVTNGIIDVGDLDVFTISANAGDNLVITMAEATSGSPLTPYLRLYSPAGVLLNSISNSGSAQITATAASTGTFLLVAGDLSGSFSGSGAYTLTLNGATGSGGATGATLDIDASDAPTKYDPQTDGVLVIRYLFGITGSGLTDGALGATATRIDPAAITTYLDSIRTALDIDDNGTTDALTDGLLIIRYMFGQRGDSLITGVVDPLGNRTTAAVIESYIQSLMP